MVGYSTYESSLLSYSSHYYGSSAEDSGYTVLVYSRSSRRLLTAQLSS